MDLRTTRPVEVLLAENHPGDAGLILESLGNGDLDGRVHLVTDGEAALDFLFHRGPYAGRAGEPHPRLVLLELDLPKVGGQDVLRVLKGSARTRAIPVVVFTASGLESDLVRCYRLGANGYVRKPGEFGTYREAVRRVGLYWLGVNHPPPARTFEGDRA